MKLTINYQGYDIEVTGQYIPKEESYSCEGRSVDSREERFKILSVSGALPEDKIDSIDLEFAIIDHIKRTLCQNPRLFQEQK